MSNTTHMLQETILVLYQSGMSHFYNIFCLKQELGIMDFHISVLYSLDRCIFSMHQQLPCPNVLCKAPKEKQVFDWNYVF